MLLIVKANISEALTMEEALAEAYKHNPKFKSLQQDYLNKIEDYNKALGAFLPKISMEIKEQKSGDSNIGFSRMLNVEQNLFDGGASLNQLKKAELTSRVAQGSFYKSEQELIFELIKVYLGFIAAEKSYGVAENGVKSYNELVNITQAKANLGESTNTELAQATSELATAQSEKAKKLSELKSAEASFIASFGMEPKDLVAPNGENDYQELAEYRNYVLSSNIDLYIYKKNAEASKLGVPISVAEFLPSLTFSAQTSVTKDPLKSQTSEKERVAGLTLSIPIFSRGAEYSGVRKAKRSLRKAAYDHESIKQNLESNIINVWEQYKASQDIVKSLNLAVNSGKIALIGVKEEEAAGIKILFEVLQTEQKYLNALDREVQAKNSLLIAAYQLKLLSGDLTAKKLKLKVKCFDPKLEYGINKFKVIGF